MAAPEVRWRAVGAPGNPERVAPPAGRTARAPPAPWRPRTALPPPEEPPEPAGVRTPGTGAARSRSMAPHPPIDRRNSDARGRREAATPRYSIQRAITQVMLS